MAHTLRSTFSRCHWTSDVMIGLFRCKLVILRDDFNLQSYKLRSNECQGLVHILRSNVSRCHWTSDIRIGPCRYQQMEARELPNTSKSNACSLSPIDSGSCLVHSQVSTCISVGLWLSSLDNATGKAEKMDTATKFEVQHLLSRSNERHSLLGASISQYLHLGWTSNDMVGSRYDKELTDQVPELDRSPTVIIEVQ